MAVNSQDIAYLYQNITGRQATDADLAYWGSSQANTDISTLQHTIAAAAAKNNDVGANTALGQSKMNLYGNPNFIPNPHQDSPNAAALTVEGGDRSQSLSPTQMYGSHLVDGQQIIPQQSGYNAQAAQAVQQTQQQQPSWMGQWQTMQDQFIQMMQGWQTQQQAQQPSYGYNGSNTSYNYQPVYSNPLMRPVTANANIAPQQAPSNMGYQNRTSLWSDV